jgi:hypothetical protein
MKLKGEWDSGTTYAVGDVVRYTDGVSYHLQNPCKAGTPPVETRYWSRTSQGVNDMVGLILDAEADDVKPADVPKNISDDAIVLNSSTEGSKKQFLITVDDDGELTATEIEEGE